MANDRIFGVPQPTLPSWAGGTSSLSNRFLDKYGAKPKMAGGGWLGEDIPPSRLDPIEGTSITDMQTPTNTTFGSAPVVNGTIPGLSNPGVGGGLNWNSLAAGAKSVAPFVSNIANSFRKPPQPIRGGMLSPVTLSRVNNSNERAQIDQTVRGQDAAADRDLSANTAAAYKAANLSGKLRAYSSSYQNENNANVGIANQQAQMNSSIEDRNLRTNDAYNDKVVESKIANQRAQSANLANASDKFVALQNAQAQRDLDERKWTDAGRMFNQNVSGRYNQYLADPTGYMRKLQADQEEQDRLRQEELERRKAGSGAGLGTLGAIKGAYGGKIGGQSMAKVAKMRKVYS